jgi:hypothetical protein
MRCAPAYSVLVVTAVVVGFAAGGAINSGAAAATGPRFSNPIAVRTGWSPSTVAAADFNGDGKPDLATGDFESSSMSVLLGRGDGTFTARVSYRLASEPTDVVSADVNGDGAPDLLVAGFMDLMAVFLNDGHGRFRRDRVYQPSANAIAVDDVDHDGRADLLAAGPALRVWPGIGGGRFGPPRRYAKRQEVRDIAVGDLDGDGDADVVLAPDFGGRVRVLLGNAEGEFRAALTYDVSETEAASVALADLNGDGRLDLAAATTEGVAVRFGNGDGSFGSQASYRQTHAEPWTVALADFDGDGNQDLAVTSPNAPFAVRSGRADGTFSRAQLLPLVDGREQAVADFNQDGRPDVALGTFGYHYAELLLNWTGLPAPPCVVPSLRSLRIRSAKRHVREGGCRVGRVRHRYSRRVRKGHVISQVPASGTLLPSGSVVTLVFSRGRRR